jgi:hypothetical protein
MNVDPTGDRRYDTRANCETGMDEEEASSCW